MQLQIFIHNYHAQEDYKYNAASMIPYREQLDNIVNQVLQCDSCKEDYSIFTQELDKLDNIRND